MCDKVVFGLLFVCLHILCLFSLPEIFIPDTLWCEKPAPENGVDLRCQFVSWTFSHLDSARTVTRRSSLGDWAFPVAAA